MDILKPHEVLGLVVVYSYLHMNQSYWNIGKIIAIEGHTAYFEDQTEFKLSKLLIRGVLNENYPYN